MDTLRRKLRSREEAIALADFLWNEQQRHLDDLNQIASDLLKLKKKYKVKPRMVREFVEV